MPLDDRNCKGFFFRGLKDLNGDEEDADDIAHLSYPLVSGNELVKFDGSPLREVFFINNKCTQLVIKIAVAFESFTNALKD